MRVKRDSNIELLRIISMFIIVVHHAFQHGVWIDNSYTLAGGVVRELFYGSLGSIGNWLFILISGYYISEKSFSWKKFFRLWGEIFFYSVIIAVIAYVTRIKIVNGNFTADQLAYEEKGFQLSAHLVTKKDLIRAFLPVYLLA